MDKCFTDAFQGTNEKFLTNTVKNQNTMKLSFFTNSLYMID